MDLATETYEVEIWGLGNAIPEGIGSGNWASGVPPRLGVPLLRLWRGGRLPSPREDWASSFLRRVGLELPSWASAGSRTLGSPRTEAKQGWV